MSRDEFIMVLCGGVGGAKLALGLSQVLPPENLKIVVNTGDDFCYNGLSISPDLDSVMYALANVNNKEKGWGLENETFHVQSHLNTLGGETWFELGDKDIATHLFRTQKLHAGEDLTSVTEALTKSYDIKHQLLPMTNDVVSTQLDTLQYGKLDFQNYFVEHQCKPVISSVNYLNSYCASITNEFKSALTHPKLKSVIIAPSNPFLSIEPILSLPDVKKYLLGLQIPIIAVSPIIDNKAVKGPAAKMMKELGYPVSAAGIALYYQKIITHLLIDNKDAEIMNSEKVNGIDILSSHTLINTLLEKIDLAKFIVEFVNNA